MFRRSRLSHGGHRGRPGCLHPATGEPRLPAGAQRDRAGNVWILGGAFLLGDNAKGVISISQTAGTSFVEGVSIDVAGRAADAIRVYRHTGRLIVQNTFTKRISGDSRRGPMAT